MSESLSSGRAISFDQFHFFPAHQLLLEGETPVRLGSRALETLTLLVERRIGRYDRDRPSRRSAGARRFGRRRQGAPPGAGRPGAPMIPVPGGVRVWLVVGRTDMRRGMNSLALQVQQALGRDPYAGDLWRLAAGLVLMWPERYLVRQRPAAARQAWAIPSSCTPGQAEAMATLIRRALTVTRAPILRSFSRIEPQVASANWVCASPIRRTASTRT